MIQIDYGVYTALEIDLSSFDFTGVSKVIMTFKNFPQDEILFTREFVSAETYDINITPEESRMLNNSAYYDFMIITTDGKCFKNGDNERITVRRGCGECPETE